MTSINIFDNRNDMLKHYCGTIPDARVLEIGIFRGDFLSYLHNNCKTHSIDGVDLFRGDSCSGNSDGNDVVFYNLDKSYSELMELYKNEPKVRLIKSDSSTFLKTVNDEYYDIIYIDGDHSYNGVKNDLSESFYKIKNGGYIMGHDYEMNMNKAKNVYNFGVKQAVDEFCVIYNQQITAKALDGCVSYCIKINK
jgi:hypothetical protein